MSRKKRQGKRPYFETRPDLVASVIKDAATPGMTAVAVAEKNNIHVSTITEWQKQIPELQFASTGQERRHAALLAAGVHKSTEENTALFREMAGNPKVSIKQIMKELGISRIRVREWSKKYDIPIISVEAKRQKHRERVARAKVLAKQKGMTRRKLQKKLRFRTAEALRKFFKRQQINISRLPLDSRRPKQKPICQYCSGNKPVRARGRCGTCYERARREGLIDNGRECGRKGCKLFCYGNAPTCHGHIPKRKPGRPRKGHI